MTRLKTLWKTDGAQLLQTWLTSALFAMVVSVFFLRLLVIPVPSLLPLAALFLASTLCFYIFLRLWKFWGVMLAGLFLILGSQWLFHRSFSLPLIGLDWWKDMIAPYAASLRWIFTVEGERGALPQGILYSVTLTFSFVSVLTLWILPIPILNMFLLIGSLFYIEDLSQFDAWFLWLMLGLFCVYTSYAYRQDPERHDQRPPLLFGALLIALTVMFSLILSPETFFNDALSERLNAFTPTTERSEITSFSLSELGFYPQGNLHVGGPVELTDDVYMDVSAGNEAFYLRGAAYDQFNGSTWSLSSAQDLQPFDIRADFYDTFGTAQSDVFWFRHAEARDLAFSTGLYQPAIYRIQTYTPTRIVFHGGKVVSLTHLSGEPTPEMATDQALAELDAHDRFFFTSSGMMAGEHAYDDFGVVLSDYVLPVANLWREQIQQSLNFEKKEGARRYEATVRKDDPVLAAILYDSADAFPVLYQRMRAHFETAYTYALDVPFIPNDENFIDYFLTNRRGYCVYFATAYSVLLADIGYETRYAEGFVIPQRDGAPGTLSERQITANEAHAWTEIYLKDIGWVPVEATPNAHVSEISNLTGDQVEQTPPQSVLPETLVSEDTETPEPNTTSETSALPESTDPSVSSESTEAPLDTAEPVDPDATPQAKHSVSLWPFMLLILALIALGGLYVASRYRAWKKRRDPQSIEHAGDTPQARVDALARHVRRYAQLNQLSLPPAATMPSVASMMVEQINQYMNVTWEVDDLTERLEGLRYGGREVEDDDVNVLYLWYCALDRMYQEQTSALAWLWNAVVNAPGHPWK